MTNTAVLKEVMNKSGFRLQFIAEKCGLTYQGLMNKVNNHTAFNAPEIMALRNLLNLSPEEAEDIFFASNVDNMPT